MPQKGKAEMRGPAAQGWQQQGLKHSNSFETEEQCVLRSHTVMGKQWAALGLRVPECCGNIAHRGFVALISKYKKTEPSECCLKLV